MVNSVSLISRSRLKLIPKKHQLAHEYCFFLHGQNSHLLREYEEAKAHLVDFKIRNRRDLHKLEQAASQEGIITAMREYGYEKEARQVILKQITMAMTSDCLHHLYEALRCFEKRKVVVAF